MATGISRPTSDQLSNTSEEGYSNSHEIPTWWMGNYYQPDWVKGGSYDTRSKGIGRLTEKAKQQLPRPIKNNNN